MELKKSWIDACNNRVSRRSYIDRKIEDEYINKLINIIGEINNCSELNIQLVEDGKSVLGGFKASYGMISGVKSFIALVGNKNIQNYKQKLGYYGEMIVLEATELGLSTCWIGGTYSKSECENYINVKSDEELICIIALGYADKDLTIKEKVVKNLNRKNKKIEDMLVHKTNDVPSWILSGVEYALEAPSAVNKKPVIYEFNDNRVEAIISKPNHGYEDVDLGISMLHFELGALKEGYRGNWKYENYHHVFS